VIEESKKLHMKGEIQRHLRTVYFVTVNQIVMTIIGVFLAAPAVLVYMTLVD